MMRNPEQTIGNLIDKQSVSFIASVEANGLSLILPDARAVLQAEAKLVLRVRVALISREAGKRTASFSLFATPTPFCRQRPRLYRASA